MASGKILIVDDDPAIRLALHDFLIQNGFPEVVTASSGAEALRCAEAQKLYLIISDISMPQMDGYTFIQELRNDCRWRNIPVIVLTGRGEMVDLFKMAEIHNYLIKPVDPGALLGMIRRVLGKKEAEGPPDSSEGFLYKIENVEKVLRNEQKGLLGRKIASIRSLFDQIKAALKGEGPQP